MEPQYTLCLKPLKILRIVCFIYIFFAAENLAKKIQGLLSLPLGEFPKQAKVIADETVKKFKAATNKLAMVEANLAQAQEKSQQDESKIVELENEMKVLSKSLQVNFIICVSGKEGICKLEVENILKFMKNLTFTTLIYIDSKWQNKKTLVVNSKNA